MAKKYLRPGGMCQFFDEHYHYQGGIDWDRIAEDPLGRSSNVKIKQPEEPYYAMIARIQAARAEKAAQKKAEEKEKEIPYNYNYKIF